MNTRDLAAEAFRRLTGRVPKTSVAVPPGVTEFRLLTSELENRSVKLETYLIQVKVGIIDDDTMVYVEGSDESGPKGRLLP